MGVFRTEGHKLKIELLTDIACKQTVPPIASEAVLEGSTKSRYSGIQCQPYCCYYGCYTAKNVAQQVQACFWRLLEPRQPCQGRWRESEYGANHNISFTK